MYIQHKIFGARLVERASYHIDIINYLGWGVPRFIFIIIYIISPSMLGVFLNRVTDKLPLHSYISMPEKITVEQIFKKYLESHKSEYHADYRTNAIELAKRVNPFLDEVLPKIPKAFAIIVSSGWRPATVNAKTPGSAKYSLHMQGKAVDISDPFGVLKVAILMNRELLKKNNIWMEDPLATPTWVHLDIGERSEREFNIFFTK